MYSIAYKTGAPQRVQTYLKNEKGTKSKKTFKHGENTNGQ